MGTRKLSQQQFHHACKCMEDNKDWFLTYKPTSEQTARKLEELTGFPRISKSTAKSVKETVGLEWFPKYSRERKGGRPKSEWDDKRTIVGCLWNLCKELGVPIPNALQEMRDRMYKKSGGGTSSEPFPGQNGRTNQRSTTQEETRNAGSAAE